MLLEQIPVPQLSPLEWHAVAIALRDAEAGVECASARAMSPWDRLLDLLLSRRRPMALADPRLEALRRFVCETRRRRELAEELVQDMVGQGYSRRQIDAIALLSA